MIQHLDYLHCIHILTIYACMSLNNNLCLLDASGIFDYFLTQFMYFTTYYNACSFILFYYPLKCITFVNNRSV